MKLLARKRQLTKGFKEVDIPYLPSKFEEGRSLGLLLTSKQAVRFIQRMEEISQAYIRWYFFLTDNKHYLYVMIGSG